MNPFSCTTQPAHHQTLPIRNKSDLTQLGQVALFIIEKELSRDWRIRKNKGSLVVVRDTARCEAIYIFHDYDKQLPHVSGLDLPPDPVVVAFPVCQQLPFMRNAMREALRQRFGPYYLDPEHGYEEYKIALTPCHVDICFLRRGPCPVDEGLLSRLSEALSEMKDTQEISINDLVEFGQEININHLAESGQERDD